MSDHHRRTQKISHHEARRRTLRAQVGGGPKDGFTWYHIADPERATNWNAALGMAGSGLQQFAGVFTEEGWGARTPSQKLDLYIQLIERQNEMFRMALNIIYAKLGIDPQSATLLDDVIAKLGTIESLGEVNLKAYIVDVFCLITGVVPGSAAMNTILELKRDIRYAEKIARLMDDTLPQILLWPERVSNIFVEYIARTLISLKKDHTELDAVLAERDPIVKKTKQDAFTNTHTAYIQANAVLTTSLGLRDGFFLWQELAYPQAPRDTCPRDTRSDCGQLETKDVSFWFQFCNKMETSVTEDVNTFKGLNTNPSSILYSQLVAYVYKIYKEQSVSAVRSAILNSSNFASGTAIKSNSTYRPRDIVTQEIPGANVLRVLDPAQYTFLLHLVYTMGVLEKEESVAAETPMAAETPVAVDKRRVTRKAGKSTLAGISIPVRKSVRIAEAAKGR